MCETTKGYNFWIVRKERKKKHAVSAGDSSKISKATCSLISSMPKSGAQREAATLLASSQLPSCTARGSHGRSWGVSPLSSDDIRWEKPPPSLEILQWHLGVHAQKSRFLWLLVVHSGFGPRIGGLGWVRDPRSTSPNENRIPMHNYLTCHHPTRNDLSLVDLFLGGLVWWKKWRGMLWFLTMVDCFFFF